MAAVEKHTIWTRQLRSNFVSSDATATGEALINALIIKLIRIIQCLSCPCKRSDHSLKCNVKAFSFTGAIKPNHDAILSYEL